MIFVLLLIKFDQSPTNHVKKIAKAASVRNVQNRPMSFIHPELEFCLLAKKMDWDGLDKEFAHLYGTVGKPSVPVRRIVGLILLKQMYIMGDETVVRRYLENPYWQHFCGEIHIQYLTPSIPVTLHTFVIVSGQ